jgi:hypothetical protein
VRMPIKHKPNADDVRRVALAALATALEDRKEEAKKKPGLTGVRAVATGAVIYTAGRAAFTGRRFVRDHFGSDGQGHERDDDADEEEYDEPRAEEDEEYEDEEEEEPRAEEDEEYEDEDEDEEPRAEEDEEYEDEDEEDEPRAEEDEEYEDEEEEEEPRAEEDEEYEDEEEEQPRAEEDDDDYEESEPEESEPPSRRPPSHAKRDPDEVPDVELPSRPSRSRAPVGRT